MFISVPVMYVIVIFITLTLASDALSRNDPKIDRNGGDLALWIDEKSVKMFSGSSFYLLNIFIYSQ